MDWSYIAGFVDGKGHIGLSWTKTEKKPRLRVQVNITNTQMEPLQIIKEFCGFGKVYGPYKTNEKSRDIFRFIISDKLQTFKFLSQIESLLIIKRQKAQEVITQLRNDPYVKLYNESQNLPPYRD